MPPAAPARPRRSSAALLRGLLALLVLALSAYFALSREATLGLDLRGGTAITLEAQDSPTVEADAESTQRALEVLRNRVDALGVAEPTLTRVGDTRISVELPGLQDPTEAAEALGRTAQLTFHPVLDVTQEPQTATGTVDTSKEIVLPDEGGQNVKLGPAALTGEGVGSATAGLDPQTGTAYQVSLEFQGEGGRAWEQLTGAAACNPLGAPQRRVAIVLDEEIISSPQVSDGVGCNVGLSGGTVITGDFTQEESQELAALVQGGALPLPVEVVEQRVVGPTLGADAIKASTEAGIIGLSLTGIFLILVYRLVGLLATVALASYGLISYGALVAIGATLTLPGLAGLLLSAGLAIDANVLVFERAREEQAEGHPRGIQGALREGYNKAWSAIADSNITTILAAALLFLFATGPVRGFGITLIVGVLASMVSALIVCRAFTDAATALRGVQRNPGVTGFATPGRVRTWLIKRDPQLMKHKNRWLAISGLLCLLALAGIGVRGLELGVEFTGGRLVEYSTSQQVTAEAAREAVTEAGFDKATVQTSGDDGITVRLPELSNEQRDELTSAVEEVGGDVDVVRDELIGPSLGDELRGKALIALAVALLAQLVYLAFRFRWTFGAGAVLAMLQDVLVVVGFFAWTGRTIDANFLAAALTIIGVSINDSIVTLDRVREIWTKERTLALPKVIDRAILQTAPRTVNTGLGAMFILASLAVLSGESLRNFGLALLLGLIVGTYSSGFTASPLLLALEERRGSPPPMPKRAPARRPVGAGTLRDSGAVV